MGASWGGLRALEQVLGAARGLPHADRGRAAPQPPTGASAGSPRLLASHSALPVVDVEDKQPIEPGHVYLAPPTTTCSSSGTVRAVGRRRGAVLAAVDRRAVRVGRRRVPASAADRRGADRRQRGRRARARRGQAAAAATRSCRTRRGRALRDAARGAMRAIEPDTRAVARRRSRALRDLCVTARGRRDEPAAAGERPARRRPAGEPAGAGGGARPAVGQRSSRRQVRRRGAQAAAARRLRGDPARRPDARHGRLRDRRA